MQQCAAPSWTGAAQRRSAYCCNSDAIHLVHAGSGAGALRYSEYSHWGTLTHQVHDGSGAGARGRDEQPRLELRVGLRHSEGSRARCGLVGVLVRIPIGMVAARVRVSACVCARLCARGSEVFWCACGRARGRAGGRARAWACVAVWWVDPLTASLNSLRYAKSAEAGSAEGQFNLAL
jgi:hypothetical protein